MGLIIEGTRWYEVREQSSGEYGEAYFSAGKLTLEPSMVFVTYAGKCKTVKSSELEFNATNIPSYTKIAGTYSVEHPQLKAR